MKRELVEMQAEIEKQFEKALPLPIAAVRNYQVGGRWFQTAVTAAEDDVIQKAARDRNIGIMQDSIQDARSILAVCGVENISTGRNILDVALLLANKRLPHIAKTYGEFLAWKIERLRRSGDALPDPPDPEPSGLASEREYGEEA